MKGFTLIEMLVALAALAVLAGGGFMVVGASTSGHASIESRQAETTQLLRLHAALRSDLTQAASRRSRDADGRKAQAALSGIRRQDGTFLTLVRRGWENPVREDRPSLQYVEYRLVDGRIERLWRRHVDGAPLQKPQVFLQGIGAVDIDYYDYNQWSEDWSGAPNRPLPRGVKIKLDIVGAGDVSQVFLIPGGAQ